MRRDVLRMSVLVLMALALAAPAGAQGSVTGSVRGMVTDPDGAGLPGVTVTLLGRQGNQTTVTGAACESATLVATNEPPQTMTAKPRSIPYSNRATGIGQ